MLCGEVQRRPAFPVGQVDARAGPDQHPRDTGVAFLGGDVEGGALTSGFLAVDVRLAASVQKYM